MRNCTGIKWWILSSVILLAACKQETPVSSGDESPLLASLGAYKLHRSEVAPYLTSAINTEDSQQVIRTTTENWLRDHVLIQEAERQKPDTRDLEKLVEEYRKSLLIFYYEKQLTERMLDTVITPSDIAAYYETHKNQYTLETDILKCRLIKVAQPVADRSVLLSWWNIGDSASIQNIIDYSAESAESYLLDENTWHELNEVAQIIPENMLDIRSARPGRKRQLSTSDHLYLFELIELKEKGTIPPIEYLVDRLERFILYERKQNLLKEIKENLLQKALSNKEAKIFIQ